MKISTHFSVLSSSIFIDLDCNEFSKTNNFENITMKRFQPYVNFLSLWTQYQSGFLVSDKHLSKKNLMS